MSWDGAAWPLPCRLGASTSVLRTGVVWAAERALGGRVKPQYIPSSDHSDCPQRDRWVPTLRLPSAHRISHLTLGNPAPPVMSGWPLLQGRHGLALDPGHPHWPLCWVSVTLTDAWPASLCLEHLCPLALPGICGDLGGEGCLRPSARAPGWGVRAQRSGISLCWLRGPMGLAPD